MNYNFYNVLTHQGNLPVRVLPYNYIDWFVKITPDFEQDAKSEIDYNGLKAGLVSHIDNSPVSNIACINSNKQIELYENYNQYLWSISYALIVLFEESIHKPILAGIYTGEIDLNNPFVGKAIALFDNGLRLLTKYDDKVFFDLPNPEKYNDVDKFYVENTNGIFTAAMTFILLHEFGHQFYGHLDYNPTSEESKKEEYTADDFAIEKIAYNFDTDRATTLKIGIVTTLCSFIFLDQSLSGGDSHPDIDERLTNAMEKLELNELDKIWGIASLAFRLWANHYKVELELPLIADTYKELYYLTVAKVKELKLTNRLT